MSTVALLIALGSLVALLILSALVSALEAAVFSLKEHHLKTLGKRDSRLIADLAEIEKHPNQFLNDVILIGAATNLGIVVLGIYLLDHLSGEWGFDFLIGAIAFFGFSFVVADLVPKLLALVRPGPVISFTTGPLNRIRRMLAPVSRTASSLTAALARSLSPAIFKAPTAAFSEDELETLVELREQRGTLVTNESEMINEVIRLGSKNAKDCMTPRVDTICFANGAAESEVTELIANTTHWNLPVYEDTPDTIVGVLDVRACLLNRAKPYGAFIRSPVFVPETMRALDVFKQYLREPNTLVIVLDEYGGFEGIVTHTDFVEEIMGDVAPPGDSEREIIELSGSRLRVLGGARLDEIEDLLGIDFEDVEGLDTIGGLVFTQLGYLPKKDDEIDVGPVRVRVVRTSATRIEEMIVWTEDSAARRTGSEQSPSPDRTGSSFN